MGNSQSEVSVGDYFVGTRHEVVGNHKKLKAVITKGGKLISERVITGGGNAGNKIRMVSYKIEEVFKDLLSFCANCELFSLSDNRQRLQQ